jgi:hypothetical protein
MKPEQLTWTDEQWAAHMDCPVQEVPSIRKYMTENFFPEIERNKETGEYYFAMSKMDTSFAGTKRVLPMITGKEKFSSFESAAKNANQNIIPKLEFNRFWSWALDVPQRALQMLHVKER